MFVPKIAYQRALTAGILASVLWAVCLGAAYGQTADDYPIADGHFYRQTAGEAAQEGRGYAIADSDGVPFWSEFHRLGGVGVLGYPISRRFYLDGFLCQATQRAVLQWHPEEGQVRLINVMEHLSQLGADKMLAESRLVPPAAGTGASDQDRADWLVAASEKIRTVYYGAKDPVAVFGLPLSPAREFGPAVSMRFQRGVIYAWKQPQPWAGPDQVSMANVGEFLREARGIPESALEPEPAPPVRQVAAPSRGGPRADAVLSGVATWYGSYFQGSPMANGEPFDMWDPTTTASNSHPLGSYVRVTRVATGKSIVVRVTDRGAFRYPIVVDLSYAAFRSLADPSDGVIRVTVEPVD